MTLQQLQNDAKNLSQALYIMFVSTNIRVILFRGGMFNAGFGEENLEVH